MRQRSRVVGVLAALALVTGCGGSLADTDTRAPGPAPEPPASDFCTAVQAATDAVRPLNAQLARGGASAERLQGLIEPVRRANLEVVRTAPGEMRIDVERSVEASTIQLDALARDGQDAVDAELRARLDDPQYTDAAERVREYVTTNC